MASYLDAYNNFLDRKLKKNEKKTNNEICNHYISGNSTLSKKSNKLG